MKTKLRVAGWLVMISPRQPALSQAQEQQPKRFTILGHPPRR